MNENVENLVLEHLRALRFDVAQIKTELGGVRAEMLGLKHHVAAFIASEVVQDGDIAGLKLRVERIEKRLNLID